MTPEEAKREALIKKSVVDARTLFQKVLEGQLSCHCKDIPKASCCTCGWYPLDQDIRHFLSTTETIR